MTLSTQRTRWHRPPALGVLAALTALVTLAAPTANAQPVTFFGQDARFPSGGVVVRADGAPLAARQRFLANLDATTVSTESFEGFTARTTTVANNNYPTNDNFSATLTFTDDTGAATITAGVRNAQNPTASARAGIQTNSPDPQAPINGIYPTSGANYLFARNDIDFDFATTPVNAFGFYINDIETAKRIELVLTPSGGGPTVTLQYGPVENSGRGGVRPGDGQLNFVGFIDTQTAYSKVRVGFPGVGNEGFGFDDLVVGNVAQVTAEQVTVQQADITNGPGWRLLSAPVTRGVTPNALGFLNLVQGVGAGAGVAQQQYPTADPNLLTTYNGGGRFDYQLEDEAGNEVFTGTALEPGRGFWWYWYDQDIDPEDTDAGGGTSESVELTGFVLTALGDELTSTVTRAYDNNANTATGVGANPNPAGPNGENLPADDDFYMIGNPFAVSFDVSGVSVDNGVLQQCFFAWDPGLNAGDSTPITPPVNPDPSLDGPGSYRIIVPDASNTDLVATWQGLMSEVTGAGATVTYTFDAASRVPAGTPPFYGRQIVEARVSLELRGTTASGASVRDAAAMVRVTPEASDGWDRFDGSKPMPPSASYAVIAPVGERDGEPRVQALLSVPSARAVPLAFEANEAGAFTISAEFAGGLAATLVDRETGARHDLTSGPYAFEATATSWTERFDLLLNGQAVDTENGTAVAAVGAPFPNPTTGTSRLRMTAAEAGLVTVDVVDVLGRRVARTTASLDLGAARSVDLPTDALAPGAYVVRVTGAGLSAVRSLTIAR